MNLRVAARARLGGVFYGWWLVAALAVVLGLGSSTMVFGTGLLVEPLMREFGWSALAISVAFSLRTEAGAIAAPVTGKLIDRFGPRWTLAGGLALVAGALAWLSGVDGIWGYYGAFCVLAVGNSTIGGQAASVVVARWFVRQRARALAAVWLGPGLAVGTLPLFAWVVDTHGWRAAVLFWAAVVAAVCIPLALLVRDRPERYGLLPDGERVDPGTAAGDHGGPALARRAADLRGPSMTVRQALVNSTFWRLALVFALTNMSNAPIFALFVPGLLREGLDRDLVALALAAQPALFTAMRLAVVRWGDAVDRRDGLAACFGLQAVSLLILAGVTAGFEALLLPFLLVYALGWSAQIPLRGAAVSDYFGVEAMGTIQGLLQFVTTVGGVLGPVLVGGMADATGTYRWAWLVLGGATLLSVPVVLSLRRLPPRRAGAASGQP